MIGKNSTTLAAQLYWAIKKELQILIDNMVYDQATSFCDDCPRKNWDDYVPQSYSEMEFGISIAETCCKEDPDYMALENEHIDKCNQILSLLKDYAGDEELSAALKRETTP